MLQHMTSREINWDCIGIASDCIGIVLGLAGAYVRVAVDRAG